MYAKDLVVTVSRLQIISTDNWPGRKVPLYFYIQTTTLVYRASNSLRHILTAVEILLHCQRSLFYQVLAIDLGSYESFA